MTAGLGRGDAVEGTLRSDDMVVGELVGTWFLHIQLRYGVC